MSKLFILILIHLSYTLTNGQFVEELPHCEEKNGSGTVLVSTLDGKLSSLNSTGGLLWQIDTGPGPLLSSNIHNLELTNNGELIRIIPSLSGTLYKFDGITIDPIPITADSLLKSSFRYSDDLVIAGGYEVRTYGVGFNSGKILYECTQHKCSKDRQTGNEDVLLIERNTQTIRAVEPKTGHERWNFSVGLHNIRLPHVSCIETTQIFDWNITAILPEGLLRASSIKNNKEHFWQYKFDAPIVHVWKWTGKELVEINLFAPTNIPQLITSPYLPKIYIGMHKKQLYIHESVVMQNVIHGKGSTDVTVVETTSLTKIPWKPIPAIKEVLEEDLTALSVLHSSPYINGVGFFLYTQEDLFKKDSILCEKKQNTSKKIEPIERSNDEDDNMVDYALAWWKEVLLIIGTTIVINVIYQQWYTKKPNQEIIYVDRPIEVPVIEERIIERRVSERESEPEGFTSRYTTDFETVHCLGKGGFGVVFEVKSKIDDCSYAVKRITLPAESKSKERVMREVKALAKLEHQNIVRYFCSWVEFPPFGWKEEHDEKYIKDMTGVFSSYKTRTEESSVHSRKKSASISVDLMFNQKIEESLSFSTKPSNNYDNNDDDSFIMFDHSKSETHGSVVTFQEDTNNVSTTVSTDVDYSNSEHIQKKINWKRPSRKHLSWDVSSVGKRSKSIPEPPTFLYIQMQLCQKQSLKEWLTTNQDRNYEFALKIFLQILNAVEYVHLRGLIHRDLKPSNIFFALDGQIKVGDFGLVKDMEDAIDNDSKKSFSSSANGHTVEVGTQLYMSPEQFTSRNYDYKVDIYSLGLILFELLVPCSTDMERFKVLTQVKDGIYPENFRTKYHDEYNLLEKMLCKSPKKRLTTIGIRARPPYNMEDPNYGEDHHYDLHFDNKS